MTNRERIRKVLANEPVDRVPVAFFNHFTEADAWNLGLEKPDEFEKNIEGHRKALEIFKPDVCKIMNDTLMMVPVDVSKVEKASDLLNLEFFDMNSRYAEKQIALTKRVMDIYKDVDAPVYVTSFSATWIIRNAFTVGLPVFGADERIIRKLTQEDPEAFAEALEKMSDSVIAMNKALMTECGADGIYFSVNNQGGFFSDEFHRKYVAPSEKRVLKAANDINNVNILHICGYHGHGNDLNLYTDYDTAAYSVAVVAEGTTMAEAKKLFNGKCVIGGFSQDGVIYKGLPKLVKQETWNILDNAGQTGVIIGADCTVPNDIDPNRFNWIRDYCIEYAENNK